MYLYLVINLATIALPLLFSFHPRIRFDKEWKWFVPANLIVASVYVAWDIMFTKNGIWGFNPEYVTGFHFMHIPIEEVMFFICIPFACLFTVHVFEGLLSKLDIEYSIRIIIVIVLTSFCISMMIIYIDHAYTFSAFFAAVMALVTGILLLREKMDYFLVTFLVILVPFFLVNGILTGMWIPGEVVWYNDEENLGIRMWTIPVEDVFYGLSLLLFNYIVMQKIKEYYSLNMPGRVRAGEVIS